MTWATSWSVNPHVGFCRSHLGVCIRLSVVREENVDFPLCKCWSGGPGVARALRCFIMQHYLNPSGMPELQEKNHSFVLLVIFN